MKFQHQYLLLNIHICLFAVPSSYEYGAIMLVLGIFARCMIYVWLPGGRGAGRQCIFRSASYVRVSHAPNVAVLVKTFYKYVDDDCLG